MSSNRGSGNLSTTSGISDLGHGGFAANLTINFFLRKELAFMIPSEFIMGSVPDAEYLRLPLPHVGTLCFNVRIPKIGM